MIFMPPPQAHKGDGQMIQMTSKETLFTITSYSPPVSHIAVK
jgi:hypothetical protein